jgi:hypothetical protein
MGLQQLEKEMNALTVRHYREVQSLFRKHRGFLDDRKATLVLFKYISDFVGLGWQGQDKLKVYDNLIAVQKDVDSKEKKNG